MAIDQKTMKQIRERLNAELQSSRDDLEQIERDVVALTRDGALEGGVPTNHMADDGSDVYERERLLTIQEQIHDRINLIESALERLEDGTYGTCERCGKKIPAARLKALPFARFCIACQEIVDEEMQYAGARREPGS